MGKCKKCGNPLDMHYELWCPTCTEPKDLVEDGVIDVLKMLTWSEVRHEGLKDRVWDMLCEDMDFRNDTIIRAEIDDWFNDEDNEDYKVISINFSNLGIKMFEFTW